MSASSTTRPALPGEHVTHRYSAEEQLGPVNHIRFGQYGGAMLCAEMSIKYQRPSSHINSKMDSGALQSS